MKTTMRMTMNLTKFNTINRSEHFDAIAINKKLDIETVKDKETGLRYFVVKNVLEDPDKFVDLISKHNAYGGDVEVTTPGYRQLISSLEIPTISKLYAQVFREFTNVDTKLSSWYYTTNIFHKDMVIKNSNNMPRFEPYPVATALCLTKNPTVGLGFYKIKLDKYQAVRYNDDIKELSDDLFKRAFPIYSGNDEQEPKSWANFEGNENWELYSFEKFEYNSAVLYDPLFFHQVLFDNNKLDSVQYSLVGFLDSPIVKVPFWDMKEKTIEENKKDD